MARNEAFRVAREEIAEALHAEATELKLGGSLQTIAARELNELPESLGQLTQLQTLDLSDNQLAALPEWLGRLTQLQMLDLSDNQLAALPEWLGRLTQLQTLNLSRNQLTALPESLGQLTQLQTLNLSRNRLTALPESLGQLTQLQTLNLYLNQLTVLPESLGQLTQLQTLELAANQLTTLPESLGQLKQLQRLDVDGNRLTTLPNSLSELRHLELLDIGCDAGGNPFDSIPECVRPLNQLRVFRACGFGLASLPPWLSEMQHMARLSLKDNALRDLPTWVAQLEHLEELAVSGNPLIPELAAASEQGVAAVQAYLRAKAEDQIVLNEAKLILIGEGDVGKSCLLDALRDEPFHKHPSTHGIEIKPVRVTHSGNDGSETDISLNTWDFGGQKVYRPTHQMFFTAPAVYLVVWKPREGPQQGAVKFWIETILSRAGNDARILVIATHGGPGQRLPDLAQQELRDRFGESIVGFVSVDSLPKGYDKDDESTWNGPRKGMDELKSRIAEVAAGLPGMGRAVPASWKNVLTALQERSKDTPWITYKGFQDLCRPRKVSHELAALYAGMLKTLGYIIHYGQDGEGNDQGLGQYMILRPDYLAKAISFVLNDQTTREQHGLITHERLSSLWSNPPYNYEFGYPVELHELFRKLMEQFDLSYEVAHDPAAQDPKPTSLIAQLVDENPPELPDWSDTPLEAEDEKKQICQIVEKDGDKSASAEGLFYRLIARLHRYSLGKANHDLSVHWQYGLMLEDAHNGRALLRHIGNDIHITVRGAYPEFMLYELTREVRWLVENPDEGWKGLRCDIMVPCVEPCGLKEPGRGLFEVGALKKSRLKKRPEYPCDAVKDGERCEEWQPIDCLLQNSTITRAPSPQLSDLDVVKIRDAIMEKVRDELREQLHGKDHKDLLRFRELHKLMSQADEQFAILMQMLVDEGREGPRLFSLTPEDTGFLDNPDWATQKFRLTLWCEHSRLPLPVLWKDENAGVYRLEKPRDWLRKYGPALRIVSRTLGAVLPVVNATTKVVLGDEAFKEISADLDLGRELFKVTLTGIDEVTSISGGPEIDEPDHGYPREAYGASFRELQTMLKKQDAGLGGLVRVLNKRREVVWVHPDFVDEARQR
ncbi:MAG: hypothetical protein ACI8P0_000265 [Planctomycetaceae bacterium]|jgi:hypothetical protein